MNNEKLNEFTPTENYHQIKSYFDIIDNAIQVGDTNRRYVPSKDPSNRKDIKENHYVTFNISPKGENMIDLYNTCITYTLKAKLKSALSSYIKTTGFTKDEPYIEPSIWVGFDDSFYAVSAYQILANGRVIYTQDNAINEGYIMSNCGTTDAIKKTDIFSKARHSDV